MKDAKEEYLLMNPSTHSLNRFMGKDSKSFKLYFKSNATLASEWRAWPEGYNLFQGLFSKFMSAFALRASADFGTTDDLLIMGPLATASAAVETFLR